MSLRPVWMLGVLLILLSHLHTPHAWWFQTDDTEEEKEEEISGCSDLTQTTGLCLDSSGSGEVDVMEVPLDVQQQTVIKTVCRSTRLVTWMPDTVAEVDTEAFLMVQSCPRPRQTGRPPPSSCEIDHRNVNIDEMSLLLPITSLATNLTYFNRYCFLCSGDPGPEVTWSIHVSCSDWVELQSLDSEKEVLRRALESGHCTIKLQPPKRTRVPDRCDAMSVEEVYDSNMSPSLPPLEVPLGMRPHPRGAPLTLLLHFRESKSDDGSGGQSGNGHHGNEYEECDSGLLLRNSEKKSCKALECSRGKRLAENKTSCEPIIQRARGLFYSLTLSIRVFVDRDDVRGELTSGSLSSLCSLEELVKAGVDLHRHDLQTDAYNLTGWVSLRRFEDQPRTDLPESQKEEIDIDESEDLNTELNMTEREVLLGQVLVWFDFIVTSEASRQEVERSAVIMFEEDWNVVCGNLHARLQPQLRSRHVLTDHENTPENATEVFSEVFVKTVTHEDYLDLWAKSNVAPVRVSPFLFCPFVFLMSGDYSTTDSFLSDIENQNEVEICILNKSANISVTNLETDGRGNLKICREEFEESFGDLLRDLEGVEKTDSDTDRLPLWTLLEHYLSLACVCLSLLCLALTLSTYTFFKTLRTIPGQNTMALCVNLFLAQALLQFGVNRPELGWGCVALGVLIHYFWLATILWTNVCSFHMHRVFTARRAARMTSSHVTCCTRRVLAYAVYAQGVPLVGVGATVSVSVVLSEGLKLGYADRDVCYLSSPLLVGVAFAAPLGVVLLLNLVFFLRAVREIARTEKPAPLTSAQNGHSSASPALHAPPFPSAWRRNLNVCMRLSSLTGLFWTLGLLGEVLDLWVLRLLSVLVNGLQGVLIALSYLPTRRVTRLYSQACCSCKTDSRQFASLTTPLPGSQGAPSNSTLTVTLNSSSQDVDPPSDNTHSFQHTSGV